MGDSNVERCVCVGGGVLKLYLTPEKYHSKIMAVKKF